MQMDSSTCFLSNPAQARDMELVAAARAGSKAAFSELYRLYGKPLYRRVFSITKNREDAEDALQEAMLHAYAALHTFEGRSKLNSWLTRIAINSALMILRRRRNRSEVDFELHHPDESEATEFEVKDGRPDPEEVYEFTERQQSMLRSIETLKAPLRAVLFFQVSQGLSLKEIAQTLDVSVATVKARLFRARRRLAERGFNEPRPAHHSTKICRRKSESCHVRELHVSQGEIGEFATEEI